jgi:paraquat-inducible protein A
MKEKYFLCEVCSHPVLVTDGQDLVCNHCGHHDNRLKPKNSRLALVFSLTALIFYVPAMVFPFMTVELYGNRNSSTIWSGILELARSGSMAIALIVFLASVLIPIIKLLILFYLSLSWRFKSHRQFKTSLYRFVEAIGRWSMLDIFLLAVLVAVMKLGPLTEVQPEKGSVLFLLVVIFTMLASAFFDPKLIWEGANETQTRKN